MSNPAQEEEVRLLRRVYEAASDYTLGLVSSEFADLNGGVLELAAALHDAMSDVEEYDSGE